MDPSSKLSTWAEIDLTAIGTNVASLAASTRTQVMAVVKANGYGHGAVEVARAAVQAGASWCGVARPEEAVELREAGLACPLLVLGLSPQGTMAEMVSRRISMAVWDTAQIEVAAAAGRKAGVPARLHLKVDTGMSRLGADPESAVGLALMIAGMKGAVFEGLFTHYARADEDDPGPTERQEAVLRDVLRALAASGLRPPLVHAANSAAALQRPDSSFDLVRAGIVLYGLSPAPGFPLPGGFRPALSWKSQLSQVRVLPPGRGVSYGHEYVTRRVERIGTVPVGYADGYRRVKGNEALVGGRRVPVVGRVCMDQVMVQLDEVPEARAGDEVVLIGPQGDERIGADEVARRWGTITYEVVCGIGARVPRVYA
jgi:alanine racemase